MDASFAPRRALDFPQFEPRLPLLLRKQLGILEVIPAMLANCGLGLSGKAVLDIDIDIDVDIDVDVDV